MSKSQPIQIVITVEGGVVSSVPARIILVDFDNIEQGGNIAALDYDAEGADVDMTEAIDAGLAAIEKAGREQAPASTQ
jgi:hypothetical protein